ncbi:MAG: glycosyltransferase family 39 protein [Chloroflexota bacterium]
MRKYLILAATLLILGLGLRLYDLTDQPIDFHATRQLRGAIIARGMYYEMSPQADPAARQAALAFWASTGQYEPSILERLVAITYLLTGSEHFWIGRIFTSLFWIIGGLALFALAQRLAARPDAELPSVSASAVPPSDRTSPPSEANFSTTASQNNAAVIAGSALIALAYYLFLPFSVQASRSFQPDPGMVMWLVLFAFALYRWSETRQWKWAILSGALAGIAVLSKAVAAYIVGAAALAMVLVNFEWKLRAVPRLLRNLQVWSMAVLMIAPTAVYYLGRGERTSEFFTSWTLALSHLLLNPQFYLQWLNTLQKLMLWPFLLLSLAGLILAGKRPRSLLLGLWGGYVLYGLSLPYQMYSHSYYHLQTVPIVALSLVPVARYVLERILRLGRAWRFGLAAAAVVLLVYTAWVATQPMRNQDYRNEPAYWQTIASYLPSDGKIMALTQDYGYRLMYYGWRKVVLWPNRGEQKLSQLRGSEKEFETYFAKHTQDKRYFLITAFRQFEDQPDLKAYLYEHYPVLAEGQGYLIFDLANPQ